MCRICETKDDKQCQTPLAKQLWCQVFTRSQASRGAFRRAPSPATCIDEKNRTKRQGIQKGKNILRKERNKSVSQCQLSRFNDSEFKLLQSFDACEDFDLTKFLK